MQGLLDFIKTPEGQGLLSAAAGGMASARRGAPVNSIGRGLLAGVTGYGNALDRETLEADRAFNKQYKTAQMTKIEQEIAQNRSRNDFLSQLAGYPDTGATSQNGQPAPGGLTKIPQAAIRADIALNGGKNIADWMFKTGTPDMNVSNGYAYDKNSVTPGFIPQLSVSNDGKATQVTVGPNGLPVVTAPVGALDTYNAYLGAQENAKADRDIVTVPTSDGRVRTMSRSEAVKATSGNSNPVQTTYPTQGNARVTPELLGLIQADAARRGISNPVINLNSDTPGQTFGLANPAQLGVQQSDSERAAAIEKAKADAESQSPEALRKLNQRKEAAASSANNVLGAVRDAIGLVGYSTAGMASGLASFPGSDARNLQAKLETIKANLGFTELQKMRDMSPTGGALGSVAVQELTALQSTLSSLDQAQSPAQLKSSLEKVERHYQAWLDAVMKDGGSSGGASSGFDSPKPGKGRVVKTGMYGGKKVNQYEDGSVEYAD